MRDYSKDFSKEVIKTLKKMNVIVIGAQWLPSPSGDFTNGELGYKINDNGISRILTYSDIIDLSKFAFLR